MLKRNLIANYIGQGWTVLMGIAFLPVYIHYLGIETYGLIGLFAVLQAWIGLLDLGMRPALNREMARFKGGQRSSESIRDLLRSIETIAVGLAALVAATIGLLSNWLAINWLRAESLPVEVVSQSLSIMGCTTALAFVQSVYGSCMMGLQRQVLSNVIECTMATLRGAGAVAILAWVSPTPFAFFVWQGVVSIVTLVGLAVATYASLPSGERSGRFSLQQLQSVWRFAGGMVTITLLALLLTKVDKILLSNLLDLAHYGYYTLATVVASALFRFSTPIILAWYPRLTQLCAAGDEDALARTFHQAAQMVSVLLGSSAVVMMLFGETFLDLWTRDADLASRVAPLLSLLALGNLLNGLMHVPYYTQLAFGWTSLSIKINIVAVLVLVPGIFWLVPSYGAIGAAWLWVGLNAGYLLVGVHFMYRRILRAEKWRWYCRDVLIPLAGSVLGAWVVYVLMPVPVTALQQTVTLALAALATLSFSTIAAGEVRAKLLELCRTLPNLMVRRTVLRQQ